ncbi:ATP-dependent helicase [Aureliella helgolandensis]|uniref:DNA 3'-5' helicase n=1 Tax=Aureliella helgolandensis TaxID=2527968 RepID=A0A518GG89_9BACT|nr:UvrD-helicase domain-containing protein [Aureliella helgolandensis]QDV27590.1 ATP-dependent DNA helicase PcrA [Aureliella helgolandensis]
MDSQYLAQLNESQRAAATHLDGPLLVVAGPGSGKTRVITCRIAHMIASGISPANIIALTFTNKAAQEMRSRLEQLVGPSQVWLGTFHGFCVRLLRRYARLVGLPEHFNIYDADDALALLKEAVKASDFELTHAPIGVLANRISYFKNRLVTPEILESATLSSDEYQVGQVYPFYQQALLRCGAVDFDDILMHTATLLRSNQELRQQLDERFRYVLVDEYQDTNLAQYVIVRHLCVDHPNLAATGDPDQSIYGWRGANVKNVAHLERDYPDLTVVRLQDNYRSTPEILTIADCLIQNNENRKPKELLAARQPGNPVRLAIYPTARAEAEDVADQIVALTEQGDFHPKDFGILYRTNAHSRLIEHALLRRQIEYQLIGGFRFFLRKEIKDLLAYLLLVHNPEDGIALQRAINTPPRGIGKKTVEQIASYAGKHGLSLLDACRQCVQFAMLSKRATTSLKSFLSIYDQLCSIVHGPLLDLLQVTIELTGYREHLSKQKTSGEESSDIATNLDELLAEASELDREVREDQSALEYFLEVAALQADTDKLKSDRNVVTLMTLHAAKGLEFSCVYVLAVEENILPHARSKEDSQQLEEERRLLFVGITRAKDQLQLSYAKSRGFSGQGSGVPSSFLMELPRSEMQILDKTESSYDEYHDDDSQDQYFDRRPVEWDEVSQVGPEEQGDLAVQFDEDCQLPPEEITASMRKRLGRSASGRAILRVGSDFEASPPRMNMALFQKGCLVSHPEFGSGEITATSGHGPKKSATIRFFSSGDSRTFRLSHVSLTIEHPE